METKPKGPNRFYTKAYLSDRLIYLERKLRISEKKLGIKAYPWLVRMKSNNQGNRGSNRKYSYTRRQLNFCKEYIIDLNGTRSAIRAGYAKGGAATQASLLLKQEKIQARIQQLNKERMKRLNINADSVVKEIALIAFSNIGNVASWTEHAVTFKPSSRLTSEQTAGIQSIEEKVTKYGTALKVKMYDKPNALIMLCRYLNILDGNANIADPADAAKKLKQAYLQMFNSVPVEQPDPETLEELKNGYKPDRTVKGDELTSKPGKPNYIMED